MSTLKRWILSLGVLVAASHVTAQQEIRLTRESGGSRASSKLISKLEFRLPLENVVYHWVFLAKGESCPISVKLDIRNGSKSSSIPVVTNGRIEKGWRVVADSKQLYADSAGLYFGFTSTAPIEVSNQSLVVGHLDVKEDIDGVGPNFRGYLPAGQYEICGKIVQLSDAVVRWTNSLALVVTSERGWMPWAQSKELLAFAEEDKGMNGIFNFISLLQTRIYRFDAGKMASLYKQLRLTGRDIDASSMTNIFNQRGVMFPPGEMVISHDGSQTVLVRNKRTSLAGIIREVDDKGMPLMMLRDDWPRKAEWGQATSP